jgi:hypothetical protein
LFGIESVGDQSTMQNPINYPERNIGVEESGVSAVAWSSIIGGALGAVSVTLIVLALGSGLGFASVSPWPRGGVSATTFGAMTAIWFIVVQWLSAAFGGYLAGRLRARWTHIHGDESYFRDTAHGVLAWALASVLVVTVLSSAVASIVSGTARAVSSAGAMAAPSLTAATTAMGRAGGGGSGDPAAYFTDTLFRSDHPTANPGETRAESGRILLTALGADGVSAADKAYLAQIVATNTGLSATDAAKRVDDVIDQIKKAEAKLRQEADAARKTAAYVSLFTALSMLIGAFIAGAAGALGGIHRDEHGPLSTTPR